LKPTDISNPDYFHKVVDASGLAPRTPGSRIHPIDRARRFDAYMINWKSKRLPGKSWAHVRSSASGLPTQRVEDETLVKGKKEPVCHLPPQARRRRLQGDDDIDAKMPKARTKRQAGRLHRRGPSSLTVARDSRCWATRS